MTNGEKLKEVFPSIELYEKSHDAIQINFDSVWWNAEYKEPTTKNDLSSELEKNSKKLEKKFGELDCISRADAIKAMQDKAKKLKNEDTINGLCGAVAILFDMPSVTPQEPKTGHWINKQHLLSSCSAECSSCHERSNGYVFDNGFSLEYEYYDFCPNCGAKMVEPQESDIEKRKPCINKEKKVMNNKTNDLLWVWIISTALLFPLKENGELKMTKNEENNLNMLMKEIGEVVEDE